MKKIDVIIPVFNARPVLKSTLQALITQAIPKEWKPRIIIIDDGSTDNSRDVINTLDINNSWSVIKIEHTENKGISAARNTGLAKMDADIVFFLGADILLQPSALNAHIEFHQEHPSILQGALSVIQWDPTLQPTPLMEWMNHGGQQNNFDDILGTNTVDPTHFFYGSCVSLKAAAIKNRKFATVYQKYGWEDLDFGRRLAQEGVTLTVLPHSRGLHHHYYTAKAIMRRQYLTGRGSVTYQQQFPHIRITPPLTKIRTIKTAIYSYLIRPICTPLFHTISSRWSWPALFEMITTGEFWRGVVSNSKKMKNSLIRQK